MDLELTEEQKLLQKSVREFAESEVKPMAKELDETGRFPKELFRKAITKCHRARVKSSASKREKFLKLQGKIDQTLLLPIDLSQV